MGLSCFVTGGALSVVRFACVDGAALAGWLAGWEALLGCAFSSRNYWGKERGTQLEKREGMRRRRKLVVCIYATLFDSGAWTWHMQR